VRRKFPAVDLVDEGPDLRPKDLVLEVFDGFTKGGRERLSRIPALLGKAFVDDVGAAFQFFIKFLPIHSPFLLRRSSRTADAEPT
jgi:hypothetical protein